MRLTFSAISALMLTAPVAAQPIATITSGTLRGTVEGGSEAFLGVPYAEAARWRDPQPVRRWKGARNATHYGPACYQGLAGSWGPYTREFVAGAPISEDCLTLNVWKPAGAAKGLPVLVFIHGGAFQGGAGSLPIYNGSKLAPRGAVVVTINYRLGVFGFLAHPALSAESPRKTSGNYGLLDQIAALKWIKANAARFGGNPANVTVSGESAGAASVNDLIVSPLAKGLFAKAVSFSGPSMGVGMPDLSRGEENGRALAAKLGAANLSELRAVPAEKLVDAARITPVEGGGPPPLVFVPHRDGVVLPHDPTDAGAPVASAVPLLGGFNAAEMIDLAVRTPAQFEQAVQRRYGTFAARLLALYPHSNDADAAASNLLISRDRYLTGLILWAQARSSASGQPVYSYLYDHPYPPVRGQMAWGAFHSSGLPYVFGQLGHGDREFTAADHAISRQWQDRLLAFMRTGKPSIGSSPWQTSKTSGGRVMVIGDHPGMRAAVSSPERLKAFRDYAAAGGSLGLM